MKLSLFMNVLLISTLSIFAVSCGKDKKKSSSNNNGYYNNLAGTVLTGSQAQTNLQTYLSAVESNQSIIGPISVQKVRYSCTSKELFGINFLPYQSCSSSNLSPEVVYVYANAVRSSIKPALTTILTPPAGYTLGNIAQSGNIVVIQHFMGSEIYEITLDLGRHAAVNPVQIKDSANKRVEYVVYPNY
ncbi:MAG: hypothetical protein V4598_17810 [Bdellovibrionota bacterium]